MNTDNLRKLHCAEPFRPFRVHLADGRHFDIHHPEFLAYTPKGRTAIIMRLDDSFEIINLLLVSSLEVLNGKRQNSRRTKRKK